jgi:Zn-dependent peptidase ImmA (M78 family)
MSTKPNFKKARELAKEVLDANFITAPPIHMRELAENYGLRVFVAEFDDPDVAGTIDLEKACIVVNSYDSRMRQTFTIAHELGHWLLHREDPGLSEGVTIFLRKPLGGEIEWWEKEANWFAANLLVPKEMLDRYEDKDEREVAKIFGVSPSVIGYRRKMRDE